LQVLRSDPNVFAGLIAPCLDDFDVDELVAELIKRNADVDLGPSTARGQAVRMLCWPFGVSTSIRELSRGPVTKA
jgi:hypothetical protein